MTDESLAPSPVEESTDCLALIKACTDDVLAGKLDKTKLRNLVDNLLPKSTDLTDSQKK